MIVQRLEAKQIIVQSPDTLQKMIVLYVLRPQQMIESGNPQDFSLTHLPLDKMAAIWQTSF